VWVGQACPRFGNCSQVTGYVLTGRDRQLAMCLTQGCRLQSPF